MAAVLTAIGLASPSFSANRSAEASPGLFSDVSLSVCKGDVLAIQGPSGSGKTVLLKCLAHLLVYPAGEVRLNGHTAGVYEVPAWRCRVMYLPQRPALLSGTPADFFDMIKRFNARQRYWEEKFDNISGRGADPREILSKWNVSEECWHRSWTHLSGGEAQRIALAIGIALEPEVLLLDEPTSALDPASAALVEDTLVSLTSKAGPEEHALTLIWVTHSQEQAARVGTKHFYLNKQQSQSTQEV